MKEKFLDDNQYLEELYKNRMYCVIRNNDETNPGDYKSIQKFLSDNQSPHAEYVLSDFENTYEAYRIQQKDKELIVFLQKFTPDAPFLYVFDKPKEYDTFLQDVTKIACFLRDKSAVAQLKKLNSLLVEEAQKTENAKGYVEHHKLLSGVIKRELGKLGFQLPGKALGVLTRESFTSALKDGLLLKDPGAGIEHGEFTHMIQILLIAWQHEKSPFLSQTILNVFKNFGNKDSYQWDYCLDQAPNPNSNITKDFRSPDALIFFITNSDDPELSLLRTLVQERAEKRRLEMSSSIYSFFKQTKNIMVVDKNYKVSPEDKNLLLPCKEEDMTPCVIM